MPYTIVPTWGGKYNGSLEAPDDYDKSILRRYKNEATILDYKTYECERIEASEVPSTLLYRGKNITDFCIISNSVPYINVVSKKFRDLIEDLEPDAHNFIPVQIARPDGSQVKGQFFYMNVLQRAYTMDIEKSPRGHWRDHNGDYIATIQMMPHLPDPDVIYRADKVGNMHLWQEGHFEKKESGPHFYLRVTGYTVSDALMKLMKKEKIYNFRVTFKGVLDTEWGGENA